MGKMYFDKEAAKAVQDNVYKLHLLEDPLVRLFEFGGGNGYWSGNHFITQVEDVLDCLHHCMMIGTCTAFFLITVVVMLRNVRMD